ncbi:MAG: alpha/beta hydrolase [Dehalococcoidia bacterium]
MTTAGGSAVQQAVSIDRSPFDSAAIDPETAEFNAKLEATLATAPQPQTLPPRVTRDARESGAGMFGAIVLSERAQQRTLATPFGEVPVRVLLPETVQGVYLHIHGGGWTFGRPHHYDVRNEQIVRHCNMAVVSVDYRLAPEHPFPAGPDDCEGVAAWLVKNARAEFGSDRIVIGGESAGGHLAALTLLRMRDRHGYTGFAAANLVYGCYDLSMTPSQQRWGDRYLVLSDGFIRWSFDNCVPDVSRRRDPEISPLYADLHGLPPALFSVGTLDPLLDDSLFMYGRWLAAGNRAALAVYPGGVHGFDAFPLALARQAHARMDEFILGAVGSGQ